MGYPFPEPLFWIGWGLCFALGPLFFAGGSMANGSCVRRCFQGSFCCFLFFVSFLFFCCLLYGVHYQLFSFILIFSFIFPVLFWLICLFFVLVVSIFAPALLEYGPDVFDILFAGDSVWGMNYLFSIKTFGLFWK
jgi:hypothetical protein